jgi:hypothetical protein
MRVRYAGFLVILLVSLVLLTACSGEKTPAASAAEPGATGFTVKSTAFGYGEAIPSKYAYKGGDKSPPLSWSGAPAGTKTFVIIVEDMDTSGGKFTHWVVYNIPANINSLGEGVPKVQSSDVGTMQGVNDFHLVGYDGPSPPSGMHHYYFRLYALDIALDLAPGASKQQVTSAMSGHILGQAVYMGTYRA